jgi:hypothetical protein
MNSFEQNEERIKADVNTVIQSMSNGQPDMGRLKEAGSDILSTAASLLSNAGIDGLTGGGGDGLGLDGNALDGLRKAADELKNKL